MISAFDRRVALVLAVLLFLVGIVVSRGDQVGVTVVSASPGGHGYYLGTIKIGFSEEMDPASVESRLHIEPPIEGNISWQGRSLLFHASPWFEPGTVYRVSLDAGALGTSGRTLLADYSFSTSFYSYGLAYLAPESGQIRDIWILDPAHPESREQLTHSASGILNFAVSPDGSRIAFAERGQNKSTSDIKMLSLRAGDIRTLTTCLDADCSNPTWRPDGKAIAYERQDYNSLTPQFGGSSRRIWIVDLGGTRLTTRPLFSDVKVPPSYNAVWSPNGRRIAVTKPGIAGVYNTLPSDDSRVGENPISELELPTTEPGIIIYDFDRDDSYFVYTKRTTSGSFSPDSARFVFSDVFTDTDGGHYRLGEADFDLRQAAPLSGGSGDYDDSLALWQRDGGALIFGRRQAAAPGQQIFMRNSDGSGERALISDPHYSSEYIQLNLPGDRLVLQREPLTAEGQQQPDSSEIWTYRFADGALTKLLGDAYNPRWVP